MATSSKLTKKLYTDITRLKLLDTDDAEVRFRLKESPFSGNEDDEQLAADKRAEYIVTGQIFPNSDMYRERSYLIELNLTRNFPANPPEVRFLTPIYHLNVDKEGKLCTKALQKTYTWTANTSLTEVVKAVVYQIDHPDIESAPSLSVGSEYRDDRDQYNRKALESIRKHGLPRQ